MPLVSQAAQALAFELGEPDAVGGVGDVEVENGEVVPSVVELRDGGPGVMLVRRERA
jgi:hypothetical protein